MKDNKKLSKQYQTAKCWRKHMELKEKIHNIEERLLNSYETARRNTEEKMLPKLADNPGAFYKYAKNFSDVKSDIGPLINSDGDVTADPKKMAELLRLQYESVFSSPVTKFTVLHEVSQSPGPCGTGGCGGAGPPFGTSTSANNVNVISAEIQAQVNNRF